METSLYESYLPLICTLHIVKLKTEEIRGRYYSINFNIYKSIKSYIVGIS